MTKYVCGFEQGKQCVFYDEVRCHNLGEHAVDCKDMIEVSEASLIKLIIELNQLKGYDS